MSEQTSNCCYRCALREQCPHPERFFCHCIELGTCNGQRPCMPYPEFMEALQETEQ